MLQPTEVWKALLDRGTNDLHSRLVEPQVLLLDGAARCSPDGLLDCLLNVGEDPNDTEKVTKMFGTPIVKQLIK